MFGLATHWFLALVDQHVDCGVTLIWVLPSWTPQYFVTVCSLQ